MKPVITHKLDTLFFVMIGLFCFGGTIGRFDYGLSLFDLILLLSIVYILFTRKIKFDKYLFVVIFIFSYGCLVSAFNIMNQNTSDYTFLITELRFYIYIPLLYLYIINIDINYKSISNYLLYTIIIYIFLFIAIYQKYYPYDIFNNNVTALEFNEVGRYVAPAPIISTILLLLHFQNSQSNHDLYTKKNIFIITIYLLMVLTYFMTTGGRAVTIIMLLPLLLIIRRFRYQIVIALFIPIVLESLPILLNEYNYLRLQNILNPVQDGSVQYRMVNNSIMLNDIYSDSFAFWGGYGIGSVYNVNISSFFSSFFVDNTFITMWYKFGIIGCLLFFISTLKIIFKNKINLMRLILISMMLIISLLSYHLITNPIYLGCIFLLSKDDEKNS